MKKVNHLKEIALCAGIGFCCVLGVILIVAFADAIDGFLYNLATKLLK